MEESNKKLPKESPLLEIKQKSFDKAPILEKDVFDFNPRQTSNLDAPKQRQIEIHEQDFFECDQTNKYRPSSIKSNKQAPSSYNNNNSSPSLKLCA